jgi:hypothetical protein
VVLPGAEKAFDDFCQTYEEVPDTAFPACTPSIVVIVDGGTVVDIGETRVDVA